MAKQVQIKRSDIPEGWSTEAADFINRLLQRKPANRLGLRGAQEVREHAWLKYYPWKELYDKKLNSPFIPKSGDNFDAKYCNAPDKIGENTKEKYEGYMRNEAYKDAFKDFYYYLNEFDLNDKNNSRELKFPNPHVNIQMNKSITQPICTSQAESGVARGNSNTTKTTTLDKPKETATIDSKFSKIKLMSTLGSSNSLLRHYRQLSTNNLSNNSTSSSFGHRRSGSVINLNY
jgi:hypothetical protein